MDRYEANTAAQTGRIAARKLIARYAIERPEHIALEAIASEFGAEVVTAPLSGAVARLVRSGDKGIIRVATGVTNIGRRRFSIAHELGHYVLRHSEAGWLGCLESDVQDFGGLNRTETEANFFAAELLLPEALVRRRCEVSPVDLRPVVKLADDFQTSVTSGALRFVELSPERCAVVFSVDARIRWWKRSEMFWGWIRKRGEELDSWSLAIEYFKGNDLPEEPEEVRASAWIENSGTGEVWEHSMAVPVANAVLSMIWIPEGDR